MSTYHYTAKAGPGPMVKGSIEAESRLAALDQLSNVGLFPIALDVYEEPLDNGTLSLFKKVPQKDLALFTRQLSDLIEAGVALPKSLALVAEQTENAPLSRVIQEIVEKVKGGMPFSDVLKEYPALFSALYVNLIFAGEVGGNISLTLGRLADFMEQEDEFRARVQAALAYPILISAVGAGAVIFLMVFAVPRLAAMFVDMQQKMPLATRMLLKISDLMVSGAGWMVGGAMLSGLLLLQKQFQNKIRPALSRMALRVPLWGPVIQKSMIVRFARTLASLLSGGVPIVQSLRVVADVLDNPALKEHVLQVSRDVEQGRSLSQSLKETAGFPAFVCHMISVGEEVNTLEKSLNKVATAYERETDRAMKLAASLLEPVMILAIGFVVGVIVIAMLLPIFQVSAFVK